MSVGRVPSRGATSVLRCAPSGWFCPLDAGGDIPQGYSSLAKAKTRSKEVRRTEAESGQLPVAESVVWMQFSQSAFRQLPLWWELRPLLKGLNSGRGFVFSAADLIKKIIQLGA